MMKAMGSGSVPVLKQLLTEKIALKRVIYSYTSEETSVTFTIPDYDPSDLLDIYINGLYAIVNKDYSIATNGLVVMANVLTAGTVINFVHSKITVS